MVIQYANQHHFDILVKTIDTCPHDFHKYDKNYADMQKMVWVTHAWVNPQTGRTILEEFTDRYVTNKKLATKLYQVRNIIFDEFEVIDGNTDPHILTLRASDGATYRLKTKHVYKFGETGKIVTAIHPWYTDGSYKAAGVINPVRLV